MRNTVSGNVTLGAGETSRSRLRSTSGDLNMTGQLLPDARIDAESISGDVRLDLAGPLNGELDISSFNGEIRNCFGPEGDADQRIRARAVNCAFDDGTWHARGCASRR